MTKESKSRALHPHCHCAPQAQQSRKAARFTFTGLIHFVRNDKGEKEPGTAFPLSLRAAGAAIQESGKVHIYWIDSLRSQ